MEQQSFDRELAMIRMENDRISDGGDSDEFSFKLSDSPGREPSIAMTSSRIGEEEYHATSFSFSTQFGCSVSSPEPLGQPLWISKFLEHDDDLQFKEAPFASRDHAQDVLFHAAAPCNQPLIPLGFDDPVNDDHDKLNQSLPSSTVSASRCIFNEQGCRSPSFGSQSSGFWSASDKHSEGTTFSSRSSSGNSENSSFSRQDPHRFFRSNSRKQQQLLEEKEEPPHPQTLEQVLNARPQDQLRQGKPKQARDAAVAHDQERVPSSSHFPLKSTLSRVLRTSISSPARVQVAACSPQKNDSTTTSAQGIISGASSPRPTSFNWKLLSLQPLNPTHTRPEQEQQDLRARLLSQSFLERSKSQGSSSNQGRYLWSCAPSTPVHSQAQSRGSSPSPHGAYHRRTPATASQDLEEKLVRQNSQEPCKNERKTYRTRSWGRCMWFGHCKTDEEEVVDSVEKRPRKRFSWTDGKRFSWTDCKLPEVRLFSGPNKEALKVAIHGVLARCKSTNQYEGLSKFKSI